jgi:uncharacterized protein (TIRG00374 family)
MDQESSTTEQTVIEGKPTRHRRKFYHKRFWMIFAMVIVLGLAVNLLLPQIKSLENSWSVVKNLTWWALGLALIVQFLSYICAGFMIHAILDANDQKLSVWKGAMIYMASYSVSLVAGGWVAGAAATVGWVKNESRDGQTALLAGSLPTLFINAGLIGLAVLGVIYLLLIHDLTKGQLIQYIIYLLILSAVTFGELAALRYPRVAAKVWIKAASRWAKLLHKPFDPQNINEKMDRFVLVWQSLRGHRWLKPFLGALGFLACDMLTLFFLFVAAGYALSPGFLLAGYSLPILLGKVVFLFPGGVGLVEVTMVALFSNLTKASQISLVGTLAYRLLSFWFPTIVGFVFAGILSRKTLRSNKKIKIEENLSTKPDDLIVKQV